MTSGFVHSIKVPRLYKSAAKIVQEVREKGGSLKSLIYGQKHPNVSAIYSLCLNTLQREEQLDHLIKKTNILVNEPRLQPWLAKILITELLWGKKALKTECKPAQTILAYEQKFREELSNISDIDALQKSHKTENYISRLMVLIIRNNRILTSRHPRIKRLFSYMDKNQQKVNQKESSFDQNKDQGPVMTFVAILAKLFLYSIAMFTLPFAAFFGVQHIMKVEFHIDRFITNCISVFAAVITVNLIIACYVYQALHEPDNVSEIKAIADQPSKDNLNEKID